MKKHDEDIPDRFDSPESSNIAAATYNAETMTLRVHFKRGEVYSTGGFPPTAWEDFYNAESKGQHFNTQIRPRYAMKKE